MRKKSLVALLLALMMMVVTPLEALAVTDAVSENNEQTTVEPKAELEEAFVQEKGIGIELVEGAYDLSWDATVNDEYDVYLDGSVFKKLNIETIRAESTKATFTIPPVEEEGPVGACKFVVKKGDASVATINAYLGYLAVTGDGTTAATIDWEGSDGSLYIDGTEVSSKTCSTPGKHTAQVKYIKKEAGKDDVVFVSEEVAFTVVPANVTGLVAYASNGAVDLDWEDVAGASYYEVYVNGGLNTTVGHSYASIGVAQDTGYTFNVRAVTADDVKAASLSNPVSSAAVRTMYINITFKAKAKLTSHSGGKVTTVFPKGFRVTAFEFNKGCYHFYYGERVYYAKAIRTKKQSIAGWSGGWAYSPTEAEHYVNARGVSSKTGWLIWTNLYTQHTYIFQGSARNWHCVKEFACSTGAARTPTDTGITKIKKKIKKRHSLPYWNMCARFSLHGKNKKWPIGKGPKSGGCVRNYNENAYWIYKNCPKGTTVCVY